MQCQSPFVGDGLSCTLDSDSDGYPDQPLDSPSCAEDSSLTYCNAVRVVLSELGQFLMCMVYYCKPLSKIALITMYIQ